MLHRTDLGITCTKKADDGVLEFIASSDVVDRQGDIVDQNFDLKAFRKNPVFLWGHDGHSLPIGKVVKIWTQASEKSKEASKETRIQVRFIPSDVYPFAGQIKDMYERGDLSGVSIGFRPLKRASLKEADRAALGLGPWGEKFERSELLEVSAVTIPANPEALSVAVSKGLISPQETGKKTSLDPLGDYDEDLVKLALDEIDSELGKGEEAIVPIDGVNVLGVASNDSGTDVKTLVSGIADLVEVIRLLLGSQKDNVGESFSDDEEPESTVDMGEDDEDSIEAAINTIDTILLDGGHE